MRDVETITKQGSIDALKSEIEACKHYLAHTAWDDTVKGNRYYRLETAITMAEIQLKQMRVLLAAIKHLDPKEA